ncbi:MAG: LysR family transcriptional regulator, partial [Gammaproteobacteria bacterium]|nr:LysR family transcriptional regulator [Gammaproteobacteria bacterium]
MLGQEGLREFVAVVEYGGFSAAARQLNVSTSFISRQVTRLEDRL